MAQIFGNAVLTDAGAALIAACEADDAVLTFTRVVTGDGEHSDKSVAALKVRTALISQKQSFSISSKRQSAAVAKITAVLSNRYLNTGYYMNELGLYAQKGSDSTTEVLFSISVVVAAQGDWFPPYNGVSPAEVVQSFAITSCNDVTVQIALETDSYALKSELGDLDELTTTDKDNVVEAINEIKDEVRPISKGGTGKNNADDACDNLGAVRRSIYANVHDESPLDDDVYGGDYIIHDGKMYFASQGKIPAGSTLNPYPGVGKNCDRVYADQELSEKASYQAITKNWEREFKCDMSASGYDVDDLVYIWCAKKIYKVTASIDYGESMVVNTNIKEWSVEDETRQLSSELTDRLVTQVTGNNSKTFTTLFEELFSGILPDDYAKYYIVQAQRQFNYFGNGEYICLNGGDTSYNNMIIRLIHITAISENSGYYEANGTFALTNYSSSSAGTATYKLYKRAGC